MTQALPRPVISPTPHLSVYALEVLRENVPAWQIGTGTLTECDDALEALADLPMFAGAVFRISERARPGQHACEPVRIVLNASPIIN